MSLNTFSNSDAMIIAAFISLFTAVIGLLMVILRQTQRHNARMISTMRDSYEKQIYLMNDKMTASMDRWKDVNHLVLGSQMKQAPSTSPQQVCLSTFLKANGINQEDIEQESDLVFVLIPFNSRYDHVFDAIRLTCQHVGLQCVRGDEEFIRGDLLPHILKTMCRASVVIAVIDGRNANVFYELGLAHAMDKSTLLVSKTVDSLPLDVKSKKIIVYQHLKELSRLLKDELLRLAFIRNGESVKHMKNEKNVLNSCGSQMDDLIRGAILGSRYLLIFNPNNKHVNKKIMAFGLNGEILDGKNSNEASWRIRNGLFELIDSEGHIHSQFIYNPDKRIFSQTNNSESGTLKKNGIIDQFMVPE